MPYRDGGILWRDELEMMRSKDPFDLDPFQVVETKNAIHDSVMYEAPRYEKLRAPKPKKVKKEPETLITWEDEDFVEPISTYYYKKSPPLIERFITWLRK